MVHVTERLNFYFYVILLYLNLNILVWPVATMSDVTILDDRVREKTRGRWGEERFL